MWTFPIFDPSFLHFPNAVHSAGGCIESFKSLFQSSFLRDHLIQQGQYFHQEDYVRGISQLSGLVKKVSYLMIAVKLLRMMSRH